MCSDKLVLGFFICKWHLCMLPAACSQVDDKFNQAMDIKCHCPAKTTFGQSELHNTAPETGVSMFLTSGTAHRGKRHCKCRLAGATCPRFALRNPCYPPNGAGYLRVVLGEEVGPVCRRGDANDKYSLDCEETENTVRLRADRHFPLNIQETGINKRRTGRTVSSS